ncbi:protein disulfide isomerase-like 1-4 [Aegilops tauschii subsp. strangulata]|uniref:protein disulfide isomerase-like 1-4 n=1 Tax=Aegilops tauschii subsp. strangulata TaxID=200361 RepID=UPI00098AA76C|nr:LOW QUALITY PROTEIN: protein disulfide isomerase-like 1-4 [Aegilops tauschii subsp. strangulata]
MAAMPMPRSLLLLLLLATPFLLLPLAASIPTSNPDIDLDYLIKNAGLDDSTPSTPTDDPQDGAPDFPGLDADYKDEDEDLFGDDDGPEESSHPSAADEAHVLLLTAANFTAVLAARRHVMVEFYAPWCGHCRALAPHYSAAATHLAEQGVDVALAKVDATEDHDLAQAHGVQGYPTLLFFIDGVPRDYSGERTKDAIVAWIGKKLGPAVQNLTTVDEAEKIVTGDDVAVLAYLDHLSGAHSDELAAASRLEDTISFYQTTSPDVAKLFHIDPEAKRPSVVLLKKEEEKLTVFDGEFRASAIAEFVSANKIPLITTLTQETAPAIFDNPIKKQILLFAVAKESSKFLPIIKETAKSFKGKLLFVFVERDNEEVGEPVANYFGIAGQETTVLAYTGNEDAKKFFFSGEISLDTIKEFAQDFLEDKLTPSYKSDPVPESNDEDVKVVVGKSLDQIVLDESKDVLLEVYAPWCGHCQSLEPIYNKLAKYLRGIDSLVIAKMDGTNNEHPRAKPDGFPTILFYPAGKKSFEPITFEGDRTVVEMYKFLKKHAAIPFKLKRPDSSAARTDGPGSTAEGEKSSGSNPKDEL